MRIPSIHNSASPVLLSSSDTPMCSWRPSRSSSGCRDTGWEWIPGAQVILRSRRALDRAECHRPPSVTAVTWQPDDQARPLESWFIARNTDPPGSRASPTLRGGRPGLRGELPRSVNEDAGDHDRDEEYASQGAGPRRQPAQAGQLGQPGQQGGTKEQDGVSRAELAEEAADDEKAEEPDDRHADRGRLPRGSGQHQRDGRAAQKRGRQRQAGLPARGIPGQHDRQRRRPAATARQTTSDTPVARRASRTSRTHAVASAAAREPRISHAWAGDHPPASGPARSDR